MGAKVHHTEKRLPCRLNDLTHYSLKGRTVLTYSLWSYYDHRTDSNLKMPMVLQGK